MKHLAIPIMEFVQAQPAHKLPVVFTLKEVPLPDCDEAPEDVLQEVLRLEKGGLIEAHVSRDVTGKPFKVEIRYVTLDGIRSLGSMDSDDGEKAPKRKGPRLGVLLFFVVAIILALAALLKGTGRQEAPAMQSPTPAPVASPTPEATATPVATATPSPSVTPEPTATPSPTPSATALPSASPSPSAKPKGPLKKSHSFTGGW